MGAKISNPAKVKWGGFLDAVMGCIKHPFGLIAFFNCFAELFHNQCSASNQLCFIAQGRNGNFCVNGEPGYAVLVERLLYGRLPYFARQCSSSAQYYNSRVKQVDQYGDASSYIVPGFRQ